MTQPQILISAGDPSGEMHAARLAMALRTRTGAQLFGLGGTHMRAAGVELVADSSQVAVLGITEVVRRLPALRRVMRRLVAESARRKPHLAILVDFPGFNLRLARRLRWQGVRNVYFIAPQVWAWRPWRVRLIRRRFACVLCIFPFEERFFRQAGVPAQFIGHPLVDWARSTMSREEFAARYALDPAKPMVAILPGSRPGEVSYHLPTLLDACRLLQRDGVRQFVLAAAPAITARQLSGYARADLPVQVVEGATYEALAAADCALVSSGTATVEAALLGTPMVVVYRVSRVTAFFLRRLVLTPYFSMVNLIAGRRVVPELIQDDFTAEGVAREASRLLSSAAAREQMKRELAEVRAGLSGPGNAIEHAAEIVAGML